LKYPSRDDPPAPELEQATDKINMILKEIASENPDPDRELAILAFQDADGEDYLQLAYIDVGVIPLPDSEEVASSPSDKGH